MLPTLFALQPFHSPLSLDWREQPLPDTSAPVVASKGFNLHPVCLFGKTFLSAACDKGIQSRLGKYDKGSSPKLNITLPSLTLEAGEEINLYHIQCNIYWERKLHFLDHREF